MGPKRRASAKGRAQVQQQPGGGAPPAAAPAAAPAAEAAAPPLGEPPAAAAAAGAAAAAAPVPEGPPATAAAAGGMPGAAAAEARRSGGGAAGTATTPSGPGGAKLMMRRVARKQDHSTATSGGVASVAGPSHHDARSQDTGVWLRQQQQPRVRPSGAALAAAAEATGSVREPLAPPGPQRAARLQREVAARQQALLQEDGEDAHAHRTGLDVLRNIDKDVCPVLARQSTEGGGAAGDDSIRREGYLWLDGDSSAGAVAEPARRFCEVRGGFFVHRPGRARTDAGERIDLTAVTAVTGQEAELVLTLAPAPASPAARPVAAPGAAAPPSPQRQQQRVLRFVAKDREGTPLSGAAALWRRCLRDAAAQAREDRAFEQGLQSHFGVGLDFLAEERREEARMMRHNRALFPALADDPEEEDQQQIKEDELFLIQLPATLPPLQKGSTIPRGRPSTPPPAATSGSMPPPPLPHRPAAAGARPPPRGAAPPAAAAGAAAAAAAARRSSSAPAAPAPAAAGDDSGTRRASGNIAHKPGTAWSGRALGAEDVPSSFQSLPAGRIGRIRVHRSGRIKLVLGDNCEFDVTSAGEAHYAQRLVAVFMQQPARCRAQGWGAHPIRVYERHDLSSRVVRELGEGAELELQLQGGSGRELHDFFRLKDGSGYVRKTGEAGGTWVPILEQSPQAYDLGEVSRKIIVTPCVERLEQAQ